MVDNPITRKEKYLAKLTGSYTGNVPDPITRVEKYLYDLCQKGISGLTPEEIENAVNKYLKENPVQPGATEEQAQQIERNKTDIVSLKKETGLLKEDVSNKITKFYASNLGETHITDSDNGKIMDMMLYGRSEQKQYRGKNLLPTTMYLNSAVINGVTFTNNGDGSVTAKGTSTDIVFFTLWGFNTLADKGILPGLKVGDTVYASDCLLQETNSKELLKITTNGTTTINSSTTTMYVAIRVNKGVTVNKTYYPQIEKGSEFTSYEPYVGGQPSPSPDYPQEIKSVVNPTVKVSSEDKTESQTVTLPYTLNAIPVSSDGNVTIGGQQYIADYVDVERGKLVRHIKEKSDTISIAVAGSVGGLGNYDYDIPFIKNVICNITNIVYEDINQGWASKQACISGSNAGELRVYLPAGNHNVKIIYELETPEEIDLTKEEIVAFKALATYYPTTNISINSEQLDGYTVFNYPISMANGWNYVKQQIGDTRDYIYDMDARAQDTDLQAAEAYVNSEYAVALTELEV